MTQPTTSEPTIPDGGDVTSMTFEQALFAVTGGGVDLHALLKNSATADNGWFTIAGGDVGPGKDQKDGVPGGTGYSYHAWDKWYVSVDWNRTQTDLWSQSIDDIDELIGEMQDGRSGLMDVHLLWGAKAAVDHYVNWLTNNHTTMQNWVNKLTSDDSAFKGKAAYAIRQSLENIAATIEDLRAQIVEERATSQGLEAVANALNAYIRGMTQIWYDYVNELRTIVHDTMNAVVNNVSTYIRGMGLQVGLDNYLLKPFSDIDRKVAEDYIRYVVANYSSAIAGVPEFRFTTILGRVFRAEWTGNYLPFAPGPLPPDFPVIGGPLDSAATWNDINTKISDFVAEKMEPIDTRAREVISALENEYKRAKESLLDLDPPTPLTSGGGGGGGNNPFDFLNNQPPPGGGGGGGSDNPFDFLNNQPPPGGGGGGGSDNPFDTLNSQAPPGGGGGGDNPFDAFDNQALSGDGSDNPFSDLPGGGNGSQLPPFLPPGGISSFNNGSNNRGGGLQLDANGNPVGGNGLGDFPSNLPGDTSELPDFSNLPGGSSNLPDFSDLPGDFSNLPGGGGDSPGGAGDFSNLPGGAGDFSNLPGGGGDFSGLPGGGAGDGLSGGGAGAGFGGEGWSDWSGQQDQGAGNGSPFSSADATRGMGGMPMMPPMMPPMGGNQGDSKERERQTWLSEDDRVWGTESFAGNGVIGLPNDLANELDEPLAPTHVHVSTAPQRGRPADQKPAKAPAERAEQTATS